MVPVVSWCVVRIILFIRILVISLMYGVLYLVDRMILMTLTGVCSSLLVPCIKLK